MEGTAQAGNNKVVDGDRERIFRSVLNLIASFILVSSSIHGRNQLNVVTNRVHSSGHRAKNKLVRGASLGGERKWIKSKYSFIPFSPTGKKAVRAAKEAFE
jgi:hypothetical protein